MTAATIDPSKLPAVEQRALRRFATWLSRVSTNPNLHERFEAVSGEGKVKTLHTGQTLPRDQI